MTKINYKGYFSSFDWKCEKGHTHNITIKRIPIDSETPFNLRTYTIKNNWDNALSEYSDTNGYEYEQWQKDKENDQILKNCPTFADYPIRGKSGESKWNKTELKWIDAFENDRHPETMETINKMKF